MKTLYKSMPSDMRPHGFQYKIGEWHRHEGEVGMCRAGFHASKNIIDAMKYIDCEILAKVSVRGKSDIYDNKQAWSEMRIDKAWKWEKKHSLKLAIYAAELVIDIFEEEHPDDQRPRQAIEAAKVVLRNDTVENRNIATSAYSAASAAYSAASAASASSAASSAASAASAAHSAYGAAYSAYRAARAAESVAYNAERGRAGILRKCHNFVLRMIRNGELKEVKGDIIDRGC